jgi:hypothetical protein
MKIGTMMITAGVVALGLAAWNTPSQAQGPLYDRVNVTLPYAVTIGDRTLPPGDYVIQQLRDMGGGSRVLLIYSDQGMKFETSAMTIPALDPNTPEHTKVILHHFGPDYYFDKVWIQGKDYGYEFVLPDSVKARERERMQAVSVAATYSTTQQTDTTTANTAANTQQTTTTQETTTRAQTVQPETTVQQQTVTQAPTTAQATVPPVEQPAPMPAPAPSTVMSENNSANRAMPNTSAGWLMMLLSGGALSGAGMSLRRKR